MLAINCFIKRMDGIILYLAEKYVSMTIFVIQWLNDNPYDICFYSYHRSSYSNLLFPCTVNYWKFSNPIWFANSVLPILKIPIAFLIVQGQFVSALTLHNSDANAIIHNTLCWQRIPDKWTRIGCCCYHSGLRVPLICIRTLLLGCACDPKRNCLIFWMMTALYTLISRW